MITKSPITSERASRLLGIDLPAGIKGTITRSYGKYSQLIRIEIAGKAYQIQKRISR